MYDVTTPSNPEYLNSVEPLGCDPVVADTSYAYVTIAEEPIVLPI